MEKFANHFIYPKRWTEEEERFYRYLLTKPDIWSDQVGRMIRPLGELAMRAFTRSILKAHKDGTLDRALAAGAAREANEKRRVS